MTRPHKQWHVFTVSAPAELEDAFSVLLLEEGFQGVLVDSGPDGSVVLTVYAEKDGTEAPRSRVRRVLQAVADAFPDSRPAGLSESSLEDENWAENWKQYFLPFKPASRVVIRPSWIPHEGAPDEIVLTIDPGRAFGTGQHETTALCVERLEILQTSGPPRRRVLDAGTGTGILAMAAARLGASRVLAVDIDPEAVSAARKNVEINGLNDRVEVSDRGLDTLDESFDLVVANLDKRTLLETASCLTRLIAPGGVLLLSGILLDQESDVRDGFGGFKLVERRSRGEWVCLELSAV